MEKIKTDGEDKYVVVRLRGSREKEKIEKMFNKNFLMSVNEL